MIKEWAVNAESSINDFDKDKNSFWEKCDGERNIMEYDFENIPELKQQLGEILNCADEVILPLSVATFKNRNEKLGLNEINSDDFIISEFIYVF